ncbi:MAG: hypothetical protein AAGU11_20175, partial [Syntrophobacteraceae bacterium]
RTKAKDLIFERREAGISLSGPHLQVANPVAFGSRLEEIPGFLHALPRFLGVPLPRTFQSGERIGKQTHVHREQSLH